MQLGQVHETPVVDVVLPARNCARELQVALRALPRRELRSVVVVDNASTDNSGQVGRDAGAVVLRESRPGYGASCQRAVAHLETLPVAPDAVIFVDPLGRADPAQALRLLEPLRAGAELALAVVPGSQPFDANVTVRMIGVIYGHKFSAVDAMRAIRFPALVALGMEDRGYAWNVEMQVKAVRLGLHISEVVVEESAESSRRRRGVRRSLGLAGGALYRVLRHSTAR